MDPGMATTHDLRELRAAATPLMMDGNWPLRLACVKIYKRIGVHGRKNPIGLAAGAQLHSAWHPFQPGVWLVVNGYSSLAMRSSICYQ
jgi:hypothetical protein